MPLILLLHEAIMSCALAIFCSYTAWFVSDQVGNPKIGFSRDNTHQVLICVTVLLQEKFDIFVNVAAGVSKGSSSILDIWGKVKSRVYSLVERHRELGLGEKVGY